MAQIAYPLGVEGTDKGDSGLNTAVNLLIAIMSGTISQSRPSSETKPNLTPELRRELSACFRSKYPDLFIAPSNSPKGGILRKLANSYDFPWDYQVERSASGKMLRLWNKDRSKALVIQRGGLVQMISTRPHSYLTDDNELAVTVVELDGTWNELRTPGGAKIKTSRFSIDDSGVFVCVGGQYYDAARHKRVDKELKLYILSRDAITFLTNVDLPTNAVIRLIVSSQVLMVFGISSGAEPICIQFTRSKDSIKFESKTIIKLVGIPYGGDAIPVDANASLDHFLFLISQDFPYSNLHLLYQPVVKVLRSGVARASCP